MLLNPIKPNLTSFGLTTTCVYLAEFFQRKTLLAAQARVETRSAAAA